MGLDVPLLSSYCRSWVDLGLLQRLLDATQECPRLRTLALRHMGAPGNPMYEVVGALSHKCRLLYKACFDSCDAGQCALQVWRKPAVSDSCAAGSPR